MYILVDASLNNTYENLDVSERARTRTRTHTHTHTHTTHGYVAAPATNMTKENSVDRNLAVLDE